MRSSRLEKDRKMKPFQEVRATTEQHTSIYPQSGLYKNKVWWNILDRRTRGAASLVASHCCVRKTQRDPTVTASGARQNHQKREKSNFSHAWARSLMSCAARYMQVPSDHHNRRSYSVPYMFPNQIELPLEWNGHKQPRGMYSTFLRPLQKATPTSTPSLTCLDTVTPHAILHPHPYTHTKGRGSRGGRGSRTRERKTRRRVQPHTRMNNHI